MELNAALLYVNHILFCLLSLPSGWERRLNRTVWQHIGVYGHTCLWSYLRLLHLCPSSDEGFNMIKQNYVKQFHLCLMTKLLIHLWMNWNTHRKQRLSILLAAEKSSDWFFTSWSAPWRADYVNVMEIILNMMYVVRDNGAFYLRPLGFQVYDAGRRAQRTKRLWGKHDRNVGFEMHWSILDLRNALLTELWKYIFI